MKKYFRLVDNPLLKWIVWRIILSGVCSNVGKFKIGDRVKYNIFAKIYIPSVVNAKPGIYTISGFYAKGKNANFAEAEYTGADVFWLKKA